MINNTIYYGTKKKFNYDNYSNKYQTIEHLENSQVNGYIQNYIWIFILICILYIIIHKLYLKFLLRNYKKFQILYLKYNIIGEKNNRNNFFIITILLILINIFFIYIINTKKKNTIDDIFTVKNIYIKNIFLLFSYSAYLITFLLNIYTSEINDIIFSGVNYFYLSVIFIFTLFNFLQVIKYWLAWTIFGIILVPSIMIFIILMCNEKYININILKDVKNDSYYTWRNFIIIVVIVIFCHICSDIITRINITSHKDCFIKGKISDNTKDCLSIKNYIDMTSKKRDELLDPLTAHTFNTCVYGPVNNDISKKPVCASPLYYKNNKDKLYKESDESIDYFLWIKIGSIFLGIIMCILLVVIIFHLNKNNIILIILNIIWLLACIFLFVFILYIFFKNIYNMNKN